MLWETEHNAELKCISVATQQIQNYLEVGLKIPFREKKHVESVFLLLRKSSKEAADQTTEGWEVSGSKGNEFSSLLILNITVQMVSH